MGKTRQTGDIVSDNNVFLSPTDDSLNVGTGITFFGGSSGIISATSFYGDGSNITGISTLNIVDYSAGGGGGSGTVSGVSSDGEIVGTGVTSINFVGTGITVSIIGGVADITIPTSDKNVHREVATEGQTVVPSSGTVEYTVGHCDVYLNGSKLDSTEYTATNGTSITLTTGASVGDIIEVIGFQIGVELNLIGLSNVVEDTSPQLGGPLDLNSRLIQGTGGINITGIATATTFSGSGASLTGIPNSALSNSSIAVGGVTFNLGDTDATPALNLSDATNYPFTSLTGIATHIVGDTTPQLGGDLDLNSNDIIGTGNITGTGNIDITGNVYASGLVGIGTDNPIRTLHVIGNGNPAVLIEDGSGTDQTSTQYKSSATHWSTGVIHGEDAFVINKSDNLTNGTAALYISSTNNVGLSTESPTSKLHVVGDAKISGVCTATSFHGDGSNLTGISGGGGVTTGKAIAMAMVFG